MRPVAVAGVLAVVACWASRPDAAEPEHAPPQYVGPPTESRAVTNRAFVGIPSIAVTPAGRLWATWYAGVTAGEDHNNYVVLSTSGDNGKTWKEILVVDPDADGPRRTFDPEIWMTPNGTLRWSWSDREQGDPKKIGCSTSTCSWNVRTAPSGSCRAPNTELPKASLRIAA